MAVEWNLYDPSGSLPESHREMTHALSTAVAAVAGLLIRSGSSNDAAVDEAMRRQMETMWTGEGRDRLRELVASVGRRLAAAILEGQAPRDTTTPGEHLAKLMEACEMEAREILDDTGSVIMAIEGVMEQVDAHPNAADFDRDGMRLALLDRLKKYQREQRSY